MLVGRSIRRLIWLIILILLIISGWVGVTLLDYCDMHYTYLFIYLCVCVCVSVSVCVCVCVASRNLHGAMNRALHSIIRGAARCVSQECRHAGDVTLSFSYDSVLLKSGWKRTTAMPGVIEQGIAGHAHTC